MRNKRYTKLGCVLLSMMILQSSLYASTILEGESISKQLKTSISFDFTRWEKINNSPSQIYRKTNFKDMRRKVEQLFDSKVDQNGGYGPLYTTQVVRGDVITDIASSTPTFSGFMGTLTSQKYLMDPTIKTSLSEIAKLSFADVTGNEWYAHLIPLNVYYGTVNGYTDGTFKGSNSVSRAEFISMVCNARNKSYPIRQTYATEYGNVWYISALGELENSVLTPGHLNIATIMEGITRGECAVILAKTLLPDTYNEVYAQIQSDKLTYNVFTDITGVSTTLEEDYQAKAIGSLTQFYGAYSNKCKIPNKPPKDVLAGLYVLNQAGIFTGDTHGNSNWTDTITRAETLALITKSEELLGLTQK